MGWPESRFTDERGLASTLGGGRPPREGQMSREWLRNHKLMIIQVKAEGAQSGAALGVGKGAGEGEKGSEKKR